MLLYPYIFTFINPYILHLYTFLYFDYLYTNYILLEFYDDKHC